MATVQGVTAKTVRKWRDRRAAEGAAGLADRTSRPRRSPDRFARGDSPSQETGGVSILIRMHIACADRDNLQLPRERERRTP